MILDFRSKGLLRKSSFVDRCSILKRKEIMYELSCPLVLGRRGLPLPAASWDFRFEVITGLRHFLLSA